jgi:hypothetical protein
MMRKTMTTLLFSLASVVAASVAVEAWSRSLGEASGHAIAVLGACPEGTTSPPIALRLIDVPPGEVELLEPRGPVENWRSCVAPAN